MLTHAIATQQQKPMKIGLPPVLTSFTILVFMPIAAIAITIKNLDSVLSGVNTPAGTPTVVHTVVMMDASTKYRINIGNARLSEKASPPLLCSVLALWVRHSASTSVIGMIASVRVSLTIVAISSVLLPWMPSHAEAAAVTEADIVTGALGRAALPQLVKDFSLDHQRVVNIPKHEKGEDFESCSAADFGVRTRAFLKIQDGCDNWCSYCIIPAARGPVRSKPMPELQSELLTLARNGYREIVLTGINLSNYGREWGLHLSDAVLAAAATPGVERVRLGSIEPDLLTPQEIYRLAEGCGGKLCPQFHLSLQSGCDATLRRMNRHYDTTQYRAVAEAVRKSFPGAALTTDMMVGFAGETEVDHQESLQFAREIGFAKIHAFAYSQRPGTRAAAMPDQVSPADKKRRCAELIAVAAELRKTALTAMLGQTQLVLFESRGQQGCTGYTPNYTPVTVCDPATHPGDIRPVLLTAIAPDADGCEGILTD